MVLIQEYQTGAEAAGEHAEEQLQCRHEGITGAAGGADRGEAAVQKPAASVYKASGAPGYCQGQASLATRYIFVWRMADRRVKLLMREAW